MNKVKQTLGKLLGLSSGAPFTPVKAALCLWNTTTDELSYIGSSIPLPVSSNIGGSGKHYNGTADLIPSTITFDNPTKSILIDNTHGTQILYFSFDEGTTWKKVRADSALSIDCVAESIDVKGSADGTTYEVLTVE